METTPYFLNVVVACPSDVAPEKHLLYQIVNEINKEHERLRELTKAPLPFFRISAWDTDAAPGFNSKGAQTEIDAALQIAHCDVLIAIFWRRFGTPTIDANSGTEHEIRTACQAYEAQGSPRVMVYFKDKAFAPTSTEELTQWRAVFEFRDHFSGLWWAYKDESDFQRIVKDHLRNYGYDRISNQARETPAVEKALIVEASAQPKILRAEGLTEFAGDILLNYWKINNKKWADKHQVLDIYLFLNTAISNRLIEGLDTDALLFYALAAAGESVVDRRGVRGQLIESSVVRFPNVTIDSSQRIVRSFKITNLRVNANLLGVAATQVLTSVTATVWVTSADLSRTSVPVDNALVTVGVIQRGLGFRVCGISGSDAVPIVLRRSASVNSALVNDCLKTKAIPTFNVQFFEEHPNAFKTRAEESPDLGRVQVRGTRLKVEFFNIPQNVQVFVTTRDVPADNTQQSLELVLKAVLVQNETDPYEPPPGTTPKGTGHLLNGIPIEKLEVTFGVASAVWEWIIEAPGPRTSSEHATFGVVLAFEPDQPGLGTASVIGSFAPVPPAFSLTAGMWAQPSLPVPRFVCTSQGVEAFVIKSD